jgi:hypothetical protein
VARIDKPIERCGVSCLADPSEPILLPSEPRHPSAATLVS